MKDWMKLVLFVVVFFAAAPYVLRAIMKVLYPRTEVSAATALSAHITGSYVNRGYHLYYLDGNQQQYYDFNAFEQDLTPERRQQLHLDEWNTPVLGRYLQTGDLVVKAANSPRLTVTRGSTVTHWVLASSE